MDNENGTTRLFAHAIGTQWRGESGGSDTVVLQNSVKHIQWIYRQMRQEGLSAPDARMSLVFAIHAGQRDMRSRVEAAVRAV